MKTVKTKKTAFLLIAFIFTILLPVLAAVPVANSLGVKMEAYTFPGGELSIYRPSGWKSEKTDTRLRLQEDPADPSAPVIAITTFPPELKKASSLILAEEQSASMKKDLKSFKVEIRQISTKPDISGSVYSYEKDGVIMDGLAFAICRNNQGMWAEITGARTRLNRLNPALVLSYVLRSICRGPVPITPGYKIPSHLLAEEKRPVLRGKPGEDPVSATLHELKPSENEKTFELMEYLFPEE